MVSKKTKEKRKDFQKQKLKIGKGKLLATSATSVNFTAKSIHLKQQSLAADLSADEEIAKHLSLCKHHSHTVRKEALVYIQKHLSEVRNFKTMMQTVSPLMRDTSQSVRNTLLELLKSLPSEVIQPHASHIMLHVHSAMTFLTAEIRAQSTEFLDFMLDVAPHEVSRLAFAKTLLCFFPLMGWETDHKSSKLDQTVKLAASSATNGLAYGSRATKTKLAHVHSLQKLVKVGTEREEADTISLYHPYTRQFLIPRTAGPYIQLQLFVGNTAAANAKTAAVTEDADDRIALIKEYKDIFTSGLAQLIKESGEIGRVATKLLEYIKEVINKE